MDERIVPNLPALYTRLIGALVWCYIDKKIDAQEMALRVGRLQVRYWRETKQGQFKLIGTPS